MSRHFHLLFWVPLTHYCHGNEILITLSLHPQLEHIVNTIQNCMKDFSKALKLIAVLPKNPLEFLDRVATFLEVKIESQITQL